MSLQWRPKESSNVRDPLYSPRRDLAYAGPDLIRASMHALDAEWHEEWFKDFLSRYNLTEADLAQGAAPFAAALSLVITTSDPVAALQQTGFTDLPPPIQMAFFTKLGQVFLAAVWEGIKDTSRADSDPPLSAEELREAAIASLARWVECARDDDNCRE